MNLTDDRNRILSSGGAWRLVNVDNVIQGTGQIGVNSLLVTNENLIDANVANQPLILDPAGTMASPSAGVLNRGNLQASFGGTLALIDGYFENSESPLGSIRAMGGRVFVRDAKISGGSLSAQLGGNIQFENDNSVEEATISNSSVSPCTTIIRAMADSPLAG